MLSHPFDSLAQLPDYLIKSLFEQLTKSPAELCKLRLLRVQRWRTRAAELAPVEQSLRANMHLSVREVLAKKRTALLEEMASEISWPDKDKDLFSEMRQGFCLVGCLSPSGVFREGGYVASIGEAELMARADDIRTSLLDRVASDSLDENADDTRGWLEGPLPPEEMTRRFKHGFPYAGFGLCRKGA